MTHHRLNLEEAVFETAYFKRHLDSLLGRLYPTKVCPELIIKIILHGPGGSGKRLLAKMAAQKLGMKFYEERIADIFDENIVGTEKKVKTTLNKFISSAPCIIYLTGYEILCLLEPADLNKIADCIKDSLAELSEQSNQPVVFIAATDDFQTVYKTPLSEIFHFDIALASPTQHEALEMIRSIILKSQINDSSDTSKLLNGLSNGQYYLGNLLDNIARFEIHRQIGSSKDDERNSDQSSTDSQTRWADIGGLNHIKQEIIDAIQLPIDYPQLKKSGLRRTGIMLYGPPGTGKTLLAKAVANECNLTFLSVKGPELLSEYVGESEDNVRKLFQKARDSSPTVIFFDEIDSLFPNRGQAGDSGGVMNRMVSQFLAELDGVGKSEGVYVIGATNRIDLVDASLLRPGRFDKSLEVPLPDTKESRLEILKSITRRMQLADNVDLAMIESLARPSMSGADFQGLCSKAIQKSFDRCVQLVEANEENEEDVEILTTMDDFVLSINEDKMLSP